MPLVYGDPKNFSVPHGRYNDTFTVVHQTSSGCAKHGGLNALVLLYNAHTALGTLSCSNNAFDVVSRFNCAQCAPGFVPNATAESGCSRHAAYMIA